MNVWLKSGIKKPRIRFRVRGSGYSPDVARRALTRTSVGNKKYEDEANERCAAKQRYLRIDEHGRRGEAGHEGRRAVAVAVRHGTDPNGRPGSCQLLIWNMRRNRRIARPGGAFGWIEGWAALRLLY